MKLDDNLHTMTHEDLGDLLYSSAGPRLQSFWHATKFNMKLTRIKNIIKFQNISAGFPNYSVLISAKTLL